MKYYAVIDTNVIVYSKTFPNISSTFLRHRRRSTTKSGGYSTGAAGRSAKGLSSRPTVAGRVCV